jgi:hypothetical protein
VLGGRRFACIGIGSETSGGIRNVRIERTRFTHSYTHAIYIKTRTGRGGVIENVVGEDLDVASGGFLRINLTRGGNQTSPDDTVAGPLGYPVVRDIRFCHVRLRDVTVLADVTEVAAESPLVGLTLADVTGTCRRGVALVNVRNAVLRGLDVTGFAGPLLAIAGTTGTGLEGAVPHVLSER